VGSTARQLVGRRSEKGSIARFLNAVSSGPAALVLEGDAGLGKTVLWEWGLRRAEEGSYRVLAARATPSDAKLSYAGIDDLLGPVLDDSLPAIPAPRRGALEVALLRRTPRGRSPDRWAVAKAVLDVFRVVAARSPLVVGIDDVQWLDRPSASVLAFALRRLQEERVGALISVRTSLEDEPPLDLDHAFPPSGIERMRLTPLERTDLQRLVRSQVGVVLPQPLMTRVLETSGGNPFFALELAREVVRRGVDKLVQDQHLGVPSTIRDVVVGRLAPLTGPTQRLLLYAAALAQPTIQLLRSVGGGQSERAMDEAVDAGIIEVDSDRVRFTHPLLASVLSSSTDAATRRRIHRRIARAVVDPEEQARHRALAAVGPDAETATMLEKAARHASSRGAPEAAGSLLLYARRLTPASLASEAFHRGVEAIDHLFYAGERKRAEELANEILPSVQDDSDRAAVFYRLGLIQARDARWHEADRHFRMAASLAQDDAGFRADVEQELAMTALVRGSLQECIGHARRALELAETAGDPSVLTRATGTLLHFEFVGGGGVRIDLAARLTELEHTAPSVTRPEIAFLDFRVARGIVLKWADDFAAARPVLVQRYEEALTAGDEVALPFILYQLSELECWAGRWDEAERYASEGLAVPHDSETDLMVPVVLYAVALLHACRGDIEATRAAASEAQESAMRTANAPVLLMIAAVLGFLELSLGNCAAAHGHLGPVAEAMLGMGASEPGILRFMADEVEALVGLDELDQAREKTSYLENRGRELDRPWALVTGARSRALLLAAQGDLPGALAAVEDALRFLVRLDVPLEEGRTWLVAGTVARRAKRKRQAKEALSRALEIFEGLGAALWSAKARAELARVGLRPPTSLELTPTEARVAELVAAGQTNREVAAQLFISPKTVEANLSRIYRKVGVRSRTELSRVLLQRDRASK
jgi:DNA-binding CsgD family transcriptional regulator